MFEIIIGLAGGLALFIFGMQTMGDAMQKIAGTGMKKTLGILTSTPIIGVLVGALVTAVVQSSSLTTVMAVGFVNASLMTLKQAISVIMGANIGTTITAQLVAFKITEYWSLILAFGFILYFFIRRKNIKNTGLIFFSLGLLLLGMVTMSKAMNPLADSSSFHEAILFFGEYKILGLLIGLVFTALVQSSSASIGVLLAMASQGLVPLEVALPILLGQNIGTCITSVIAAIGTSLSARRAAAAHVMFNLLGAIVFLTILPIFNQLVLAVSPVDDIPRQIANAHTIFNVLTTVVFLPLINQYTKLITKIIPGTERIVVHGTIYLDWHLASSPEFAIDLAKKELIRMADLAMENLKYSVEGLIERDTRKIAIVEEQEEVVDDLEKEICRYLAKVAQYPMTEKSSIFHTGLLHVANDVERISDHADNIADIAKSCIEENRRFSDIAIHDINEMYLLVSQTFRSAIHAMAENEDTIAVKVHNNEQKIDDMERSLRKAHMKRLTEGSCTPDAGVLFLDIISNFERVGDHSNNIASISQGKI